MWPSPPPCLRRPLPRAGLFAERQHRFHQKTQRLRHGPVGFAVFNSEGTIRFTNVNLTRAPNSLDKNLNFVGWRDGFHCKENRAKIIWDGCKMEGLYDDVFNISASTMYVKEAKGQDEINMFWPETKGTYSPLKKGDKLTIIDTSTGQLIAPPPSAG